MSAQRTRDCAEAMVRFSAWCELHGVSALPAQDQTVLRYFHAHYPNWAASYVKQLWSYMKTAHADAGHPEPAPARISAYVGQLRRDPAVRRKSKALPLRTTDAAKAAEEHAAREEEPSIVVARLRALLVLTRLTGVGASAGLNALRRLPREAFDVRQSTVRVRFGDQVFLVDAVRDPKGFAVVSKLLADTDSVFPLAAPEAVELLLAGDGSAELRGQNTPSALKTWMLRGPCSTAWARSGQQGTFEVAAIAKLSDEDFDWLLAGADRYYARHRRDMAYVLTGLFTARRHSDLARFQFEDVTAYGTLGSAHRGFEIVERVSKTDPYGRDPQVRTVAHVDPSGCPPVCPACALALHMETQRRQGRSSGPLFATLYANKWRAMTRQNASGVIQRFADVIDSPALKGLSSRGLRVGATTSAAEAGWPLWEIASDLTGHKTLEICRLYVRAYDPWSFQVELSL